MYRLPSSRLGRSILAGLVCVADGSELGAAKLRAVLTYDPGMGVFRHGLRTPPRSHK